MPERARVVRGARRLPSGRMKGAVAVVSAYFRVSQTSRAPNLVHESPTEHHVPDYTLI